MTTEISSRPLGVYAAGSWVTTDEILEVTSPYDGRTAGLVCQGGVDVIEAATEGVSDGAASMRSLPSYERAGMLERIAEGIASRHEELARTMALEAGKPIRDARIEVDRAVLTMRTSAAEATRMHGEELPLDVIQAASERLALTKRVPIGPVLGITPFNFPLNLVCHKVGPALAAGNSIFIKPAPKTPLTALALAEIASAAGVPGKALAVVLCSNDMAQALVADERFKLLTFTGSDAVGWRLKSLAGKKKVVLELGGNAGAIVDKTADLDYAAGRIAVGGFSYAGQSCISVQRTFVERSIFQTFADRLVERVSRLKVGDPLDETTDVGPMINPESVKRIAEWVEEAVAEGAEILCGGHTMGNAFQPTVLVNVRPKARVCSHEAFAPIVSLLPFDDFDDALQAVNDSRFGLQAGVFTENLNHIMSAFDRLEVGGVIVNDVPTFRVDPMPYGGVKDSGLGREGIRYAIEEMTELRLLVLRRSYST